jgi:Cdc6-like AAA superfamily ATPase
LKKNTKGLFIFYGERGTGKTSVINYLANNLNRTVIFVPNSMIEHTINNSDFRKFLNKYHNPIVILDDCEMIFNDYFNRTNLSAYNLLQLSEGIFLDNINATFITIFNVDDISEIDQNFIDCNNLIDIVEFEYLSSDESNELSAHLSDKTKYKNKNKLNDIIKKRKVLNNKKIGF